MPDTPTTIEELRAVAIDGIHRKKWTTAHIRAVAMLLNEVADEMDYADERLADIFETAPRTVQ